MHARSIQPKSEKGKYTMVKEKQDTVKGMRVLHFTHGKVNPAGHNGISRVVYFLNKYEKLDGLQSEIWSVVDGVKNHETVRRDKFVTVEAFPRIRSPFGAEIFDWLQREKDSIDLVHIHQMWFLDKDFLSLWLKRNGIPYIVTAHGTYSKPQSNRGKKWVAKHLYELPFLNRAREIHALTREEISELHAYGVRVPIFVVPNGLEPGEIPPQRRKDFFGEKAYVDKVKFLWVGVLRADKNLDSLARAVALLPEEVRNRIVVVIVGPDAKGNRSRLETLCRDLGVAEQFDFIGPLYGQEKFDAIESSDVYVMPSFSEALSLAVMDAMACGKPCLLTRQCNWTYYTQYRFGLFCEPWPEDLARGIVEMLERKSEWPEMGSNAKRLVQASLSWERIAGQMINEYGRIVGKSS